MTDTRIHEPCGRPMTPTSFDHHNRNHPDQPIWICTGPCAAWEPREGWHGDWPAGWDGERWTG